MGIKVFSMKTPVGSPASSRSIFTVALGSGVARVMPATASAFELATDTRGRVWRQKPQMGRM